MNGNHKPVGRSGTASNEELRDARLTAYALGQLDGQEKALVEAEISASPAARQEVMDVQALAEQVREANRAMVVASSETLRAALELRLSRPLHPTVEPRSEVVNVPLPPAKSARRNWRALAALATAVCVLAAAVGLYLGRRDRAVERDAGQVAAGNTPAPEQVTHPVPPPTSEDSKTSEDPTKNSPIEKAPVPSHRLAGDSRPSKVENTSDESPSHVMPPAPNTVDDAQPPAPPSPSQLARDDTAAPPEKRDSKKIGLPGSTPQVDKLVGPRQTVAGISPRGMRHFPAANPGFLEVYMSTKPPKITIPLPREKPKKPWHQDSPGMGKFGAGARGPAAAQSPSGAKDTESARSTNVGGKSRPSETDPALPPGMRPEEDKTPVMSKTGRDAAKPGKKAKPSLLAPAETDVSDEPAPDLVAEENKFLPATKFPYSAFSLEVDPRAYALVGRYLHAGQLPRPDQVQIEDLVNYFDYDDRQPADDDPFAVRVEAADCPWAREHRLVRIAVVGQYPRATAAERSRAGQGTSPPPPIANDVRVQVQFNPALVTSYRLIGYDSPPAAENKADSGLVTGLSFAAGQTVVALYEIVPAKPASPAKPAPVDARPSKKQRTPNRDLTAVEASTVLLTVRLRYQRPSAKEYWLLEAPWTDPGQSFDGASRDFRFSAAVAAFGMALRGSQYRGDITLEAVERIADSARGEDRQRAGFVDLVRLARQLGL